MLLDLYVGWEIKENWNDIKVFGLSNSKNVRGDYLDGEEW